MSTTRTRLRRLTFAALAITAAGCGSTARSASGSGPIPSVPAVMPADGQAVAQAAATLLVPFRMQVQRASVAPRPGLRGGPELSLYVRPARPEAASRYAQRFTPLAAAVIPELFARYPGIQWIDLCQEPAQSSGAWETVPVTRIEITREGSARVDWPRTDLATVLALVHAKPLEFLLEWHNGIGRTPVWSAAAAKALTLGT